ncbi:predicted protein [Streptomyces iranensis]|uniref:Uncharacterized protein n=1 Tax=Streptomyces iranensis TaxID=576784 RepID=A0A060ZMT8_9ACTN|nr:predicted protein [Streptomyces iranensis]
MVAASPADRHRLRLIALVSAILPGAAWTAACARRLLLLDRMVVRWR